MKYLSLVLLAFLFIACSDGLQTNDSNSALRGGTEIQNADDDNTEPGGEPGEVTEEVLLPEWPAPYWEEGMTLFSPSEGLSYFEGEDGDVYMLNDDGTVNGDPLLECNKWYGYNVTRCGLIDECTDPVPYDVALPTIRRVVNAANSGAKELCRSIGCPNTQFRNAQWSYTCENRVLCVTVRVELRCTN